MLQTNKWSSVSIAFTLGLFFLPTSLKAEKIQSKETITNSPPPITWPCGTISYSFLNSTSDMGLSHQQNTVKLALDEWAAAFNIQFVQASTASQADIKFSWDHYQALSTSQQHYAKSTFGAPYPTSGEIIFNDNRQWTSSWMGSIYNNAPVDLRTVAMYNIGITLGLNASANSDSVMRYYSTSIHDLSLKDTNKLRQYYSHCSAFGNYQLGSKKNYLALTSTSSPWHIGTNDKYIGGDFAGDNQSEMLSITNGNTAFLTGLYYPSNPSWQAMSTVQSNLNGNWAIRNDDLYVAGDFDGNGKDELLAANPDGHYTTLKFSTNWASIQSATNGDIDVNDKLISGDFDGDGKDEVMLIKANGNFYTMRLNLTGTANWDIIDSGQNTIYWWRLSTSDYYVSGDYDGDGKDELLALNPNGWHHTMKFVNNQWQYIEGNGSGQVGGANIGTNDQYLSADFNNDGKDEIILINKYHSWSLMLGFSNGQWQAITHNQGNDMIANWKNNPNDITALGDFNEDGNQDLMLMSPTTGLWQLISF